MQKIASFSPDDYTAKNIIMWFYIYYNIKNSGQIYRLSSERKTKAHS